jgi:hypothetical protein
MMGIRNPGDKELYIDFLLHVDEVTCAKINVKTHKRDNNVVFQKRRLQRGNRNNNF